MNTAIHERGGIVAVLGRAGTTTADARRIGHFHLSRQSVFDANPVTPWDVQIVLVEEATAFTQAVPPR